MLLIYHAVDIILLHYSVRIRLPIFFYPSFFFTENGSLLTWGEGDYNQLGRSRDETTWVYPDQMMGLDEKVVTQISCGAYHTLALTDLGEMYSCGYNQHGQLGLGDFAIHRLPEKIRSLDGRRVEIIASGWHHSMAVLDDGILYSWGYNEHGECGHGHRERNATPEIVGSLVGRRIVMIAGGQYHSLALDASGDLYSWGWNAYGELGLGSEDDRVRLAPERVDQFPECLALACGGRFSMVLQR